MRVLCFFVVWVLAGAALSAPIPENFNKNTVGFVYLGDTNGANLRPIGTCFFVARPFTNDLSIVFMVTAKHVLQDEAKRFHKQVFIRLPKRSGGLDQIVFPLDPSTKVFTNSAPEVDLAVVPVSPQITENYQVVSLPYNLLTTEAHIKKFRIREGDDMFFMGLFDRFVSMNANTPIVRFGRLSMIPDGPVQIDGGPLHVYLSEITSFPGNSGAPVFFYFDQFRNPNDTSVLLAGVMRGYYLQGSEIRVQKTGTVPYSLENSGIALITPAYQIKEILDSAEMAAWLQTPVKSTIGEGK